jgi:prophage maintenance system killer protein
MSHSFHNADKRTHRKIMLVGLLLRGVCGLQLFCQRAG